MKLMVNSPSTTDNLPSYTSVSVLPSEAVAYAQPVEFSLDDEAENFFFEDAESTAEILYSGEEADNEKP